MYYKIIKAVRRIFTSITFLVVLFLGVALTGVFATLITENPNWLDGARVIAGLPVLFLFFRSFIRLGPFELNEEKLTHEDASIWTEGREIHGLDRAAKWIEQRKDGRARQVGFYLSIVAIVYYFSAPILVSWISVLTS